MCHVPRPQRAAHGKPVASGMSHVVAAYGNVVFSRTFPDAVLPGIAMPGNQRVQWFQQLPQEVSLRH